MLAVGIFLLLACASAWVTAHHQPENEVEAYKKLLRAKGEKLEINEVLPSPVPPEQNCVDAVRMAFGLIHSGSGIQINQMQMVAPGKANDRRFIAALQPLVGAIPVAAMQQANYRVDRPDDKQSPDAAARWLAQRIGR